MSERPHWSSRLAVESILLLAATTAGTAVWVVLVLLLEFANLEEVSVRLAPTPLPRAYAHGSPVALVVAAVALLGTVALASAARRRRDPERRLAAAVGEAVVVQEHGLRIRGGVALRGAATAAGAALGIALLVWLPADLRLGALGVALAALAGAGTALWWSRPHPGAAAVGIGLVLVAYPPAVLRLVQVAGPRQPLGGLAATDATWLVVLAWTPLVVLAGAAARDLELDWRAGVPLAMALLLVAAGTVGTAGRTSESPDPRATVEPAGSVNLSDARTSYVPRSSVLQNRSVVAVGTIRFHNPANTTRIATVPDVDACLYTPERHDLEVRQGRLEGERERGPPTLYPLFRQFRMAPGRSVTARLFVDVDQLEGAALADTGSVPVTVADACPGRSGEPRLVLTTGGEYDPTIVHGIGYRPNESRPGSR